MILGGSPIKVAVPPILDAKICEIRYGLTSTFNCAVMLKVIGTVKSTVVTLSNKAEQTIVRAESATNNAIGRAFTFFAAHIAKKLNNPVSLVMFTIIIIPIRSPKVLKSIWDMAVS